MINLNNKLWIILHVKNDSEGKRRVSHYIYRCLIIFAYIPIDCSRYILKSIKFLTLILRAKIFLKNRTYLAICIYFWILFTLNHRSTENRLDIGHNNTPSRAIKKKNTPAVTRIAIITTTAQYCSSINVGPPNGCVLVNRRSGFWRKRDRRRRWWCGVCLRRYGRYLWFTIRLRASAAAVVVRVYVAAQEEESYKWQSVGRGRGRGRGTVSSSKSSRRSLCTGATRPDGAPYRFTHVHTL